jgi:predicted phosphodiesterase
MKILLLSDLHIEFTNNDYPTPQVDCDVIVLAGDIGVGLNGIKLANKWNEELDIPIVIINGNHEYYNNRYCAYYGNEMLNMFQEMQCRQLSLCNKNVHFLENGSIVINGVRFLGCTLWTNFKTDKNLTQEQEMYQAKQFLNDYRVCYYEPGKLLTPQDTLEMHYKSRKWLNKELKKPFDGKTVVVTHHSPILVSNYPDKNGGFCNVMDNFIKKHNKSINAWFFGHTHFCTDSTIGDIRIISNQNGYLNEDIDGFNEFKVINV